MIILDTDVVSELMKPVPAAAVDAWVSRQASAALYTTSITEAEILRGVALLPASQRRTRLQAAAEAMFAEDFRGRQSASSFSNSGSPCRQARSGSRRIQSGFA